MSELEEWFDTYNHRYFRGSLKPCRLFWSTKLKPLGQFGGNRQARKFYIAINQKVRWSSALWHMVLLHEMVHLKLVDKDRSPLHIHSRMFNREMKKLAARGAFVGIW